MQKVTLSGDDIEKILIRYFREGDRSLDIFQETDPELDVNLAILDHIMNFETVFDKDYLVFTHFKDENSTILDIGANYGYSATTIWQVGSASAVASFEPIRGYELILEELGRRVNANSKRYESYCTGVRIGRAN